MYSLITAGIFFQISLPLSDNSFLLNIICLKGIAQVLVVFFVLSFAAMLFLLDFPKRLQEGCSLLET